MIDIHSHLLPSVDDGSKSLEETINLIKLAIQDGVSDICITPHFCRVDNYVVKKEELITKFNDLKEACKDLKINLYLGNELMIEQNLDLLLENDELCTLNNSKYVLVEFPFNKYKEEYNDYLYDISSLDLKIIIAHPERYDFISDELIDRWLHNGYLLQANANSFKDNQKKKLLFKLIENGKLSFVASDAHNTHRNTVMSDIYELIAHKFNDETAETLFNTNPKHVLNNESIIKLNKVKKRLF